MLPPQLRLIVLSALAALGCATSGDLSLGSFPQESVSSGSGGLGGGPPLSGTGASEGSGGNTGASSGSGGLGGMPSLLPPCSSGAPLPVPDRRYDFSGTGSEVVDRQGGDSGEVIGTATLDNSGILAIDGDDYVDLPNGILGAQESVTILIWATAAPGPAYWRILDFGTSSGGEDPPGSTVGTYYIALTPETGFDQNGLGVLIARGGPSSEDRALTNIHVDEKPLAVAVVFDGEDDQLRLFYSGEVVSEASLTGPLSEIDDVNNWLGRSQYSADPYFQGSYDELRIYESALTSCQISALTALGPDNPG